jgi:hypothetical protein
MCFQLKSIDVNSLFFSCFFLNLMKYKVHLVIEFENPSINQKVEKTNIFSTFHF